MHAWYFPSGIRDWGAKRCPNQTRRPNSGNALEPFFFRFVRNQDFPLIYMYVYKYICFRWHHSLLILPPTLFIRHTFIQWASDFFFGLSNFLSKHFVLWRICKHLIMHNNSIIQSKILPQIQNIELRQKGQTKASLSFLKDNKF